MTKSYVQCKECLRLTEKNRKKCKHCKKTLVAKSKGSPTIIFKGDGWPGKEIRK